MQRDINKIIIHCSDSYYPKHDHINVIDKWHKQRGFKEVGYHYFIQKNGNIQKGRQLQDIGAHCEDYNIDSIGICLHGKNEFTEKQFKSLAFLIKKLQKDYNIKEIEGHYNYTDDKTCPNFDVDIFKENYLNNNIIEKLEPLKFNWDK